MQYSILENENLEGVAPNLIHKKKIFSYFTVQLVQLANFLHKTTVYVKKYDVNSSLNINYIQQKFRHPPLRESKPICETKF